MATGFQFNTASADLISNAIALSKDGRKGVNTVFKQFTQTLEAAQLNLEDKKQAHTSALTWLNAYERDINSQSPKSFNFYAALAKKIEQFNKNGSILKRSTNAKSAAVAASILFMSVIGNFLLSNKSSIKLDNNTEF